MDNYPREGLRLRSEQGVHPEVRQASINFCKWLRTQISFPIRVVIYLKKGYEIQNSTTKEWVSATFFGLYDKEVEPYIRIATGDYEELIEKRGKNDALYAMLESIAHELTHFEPPMTEVTGFLLHREPRSM